MPIYCVLNVMGAFNQEKAPVEALSMIVKFSPMHRDGSFAALVLTCWSRCAPGDSWWGCPTSRWCRAGARWSRTAPWSRSWAPCSSPSRTAAAASASRCWRRGPRASTTGSRCGWGGSRLCTLQHNVDKLELEANLRLDFSFSVKEMAPPTRAWLKAPNSFHIQDTMLNRPKHGILVSRHEVGMMT